MFYMYYNIVKMVWLCFHCLCNSISFCVVMESIIPFAVVYVFRFGLVWIMCVLRPTYTIKLSLQPELCVSGPVSIIDHMCPSAMWPLIPHHWNLCCSSMRLSSFWQAITKMNYTNAEFWIMSLGPKTKLQMHHNMFLMVKRLKDLKIKGLKI